MFLGVLSLHYGPADPPPVPEWLNRITKLSAVQIISRRRITRRLSLRVVTKKIFENTFVDLLFDYPIQDFPILERIKNQKVLHVVIHQKLLQNAYTLGM